MTNEDKPKRGPGRPPKRVVPRATHENSVKLQELARQLIIRVQMYQAGKVKLDQVDEALEALVSLADEVAGK